MMQKIFYDYPAFLLLQMMHLSMVVYYLSCLLPLMGAFIVLTLIAPLVMQLLEAKVGRGAETWVEN